MRKLCGFDLNGWCDSAARNWLTLPDGREQEDVTLIEGGILGVVVKTGATSNNGLVGGAQASLAPHGLGGGWGIIGTKENRIKVIDLLRENASIDYLAAAFGGLSPNIGIGVASIDDHNETSELLQEQMLNAMRKAKVSRPLLVWRSILVCLSAIQKGLCAKEQYIGIINHVGVGLSFQKLRIRSIKGYGEDLWVPERSHVGQLVKSDWGYKNLSKLAETIIRSAARDGRAEHLQWARNIGNIALGLPVQAEVLRQANRNFEVLTPVSTISTNEIADLADCRAQLAGCDLVILETHLQNELKERFHQAVKRSIGTEILLLDHHCVARGALFAAQRLSQNIPVYFDFLPQISTIVQRRDRVDNFNLIDSDETLPAGQIYRSKTPARLAIQAGQDRFSIYINKELAEHPRKAEINIGFKATENLPVDLWVEQTPAAGRAKILVNSIKFSQPFYVDWDRAEEMQETWNELLDRMETPPPTIPNRLILPCGYENWQDGAYDKGLISLIDENVNRQKVDWLSLANCFSKSMSGTYAISSDGEIPQAVPDETIAKLDILSDRAVKELFQATWQSAYDTAPVKFLTWQFRHCPARLAPWLLDAWDYENRKHPVFRVSGNWILAFQGLGRIANSEDIEKQAIKKLLAMPLDRWFWREQTAAMAFLLSRSDTAPKLLQRQEVEHLAKRVFIEFKDNFGTDYTCFNYAPFLLVGLLRWRLAEPYALVVGNDPLADKLAQAVEKTIIDLRKVMKPWLKSKYTRILEQTLDELHGEGSNPELLLDIYGK